MTEAVAEGNTALETGGLTNKGWSAADGKEGGAKEGGAKEGGAKEGGLGLLPNIGDAASVTLDAAPENFNATLLRKLFIFNTIYSLVYLQ